MHSRRVLLAAAAVVIAIGSTIAVAGGLISSSSGNVVKLSVPPASVALNALENSTSTVAFDERSAVTVGTPIAVDAVSPGTSTRFPNGSATIPTGTLVDSHLIHSDIPSRNATSHRTGSVTFRDDILGVIASTTRLAASDGPLGAPGTTYAGNTQWRGLESSGEYLSSLNDKFTISADKRTVSFDINTLVMDELRVITKSTNPLVTTITDTPDPVQAGNTVSYTLTVTNTGATTATNVQVADQFPGATFVSANSSGGCSGTTTVTCSLGSIAADGNASATVVVRSPGSVPAGGLLANTATAPPGRSPVTATTAVVSPALTTDITDAPDPVTAGNDVQYTLTVTNNGIAPVGAAHVVDTLPTGASFVTASAPNGCTGTGPVDCDLGPLAVGASAQAFVVVTSPATVPDGGTMTDSAVASPGANATATQVTTVEAPTPGISKGFVLPGGSLSIDGADPATITLPNTGPGAPVLLTQGAGSFCDGPCSGIATDISSFPGYSDPNHPIHLTLTYTFPDSPTSLTDAATAFGSTIYKNDDPSHPDVGVTVPPCAAPGSGVANPHPCVDAHTITQPTLNSFVVTFEIVYLSGDPRMARR